MGYPRQMRITGILNHITGCEGSIQCWREKAKPVWASITFATHSSTRKLSDRWLQCWHIFDVLHLESERSEENEGDDLSRSLNRQWRKAAPQVSYMVAVVSRVAGPTLNFHVFVPRVFPFEHRLVFGRIPPGSSDGPTARSLGRFGRWRPATTMAPLGAGSGDAGGNGEKVGKKAEDAWRGFYLNYLIVFF